MAGALRLDVPRACSAAISFSGIPHRPKPSIMIVAPSGMSATASSAVLRPSFMVVQARANEHFGPVTWRRCARGVTFRTARADSYHVRSPTWRVACLLSGSGCCALVYQVAWLRDFRLIFGASTAASAAVLAIFIGGLGLGGLLLGPRADRHPRPLQLYASLEMIVAISAAATPFLLTVVEAIYIASGGTARLGTTLATIARLALSTLVLLVPTVAMGGTLPAAARAVTREADMAATMSRRSTR